jgi:uncharacterized DUF497 family protein
MEFEWDPQKAMKNLRKHGVAFAEAATIFGDPLAVTAPDPDHAAEEHRNITIGTSDRLRLLIVSHVDRGGRVRIISARQLTRSERKSYEEENQD